MSDGQLHGMSTVSYTHLESFPEQIVYTALGHIHKAQRVSGRENIRYAGSPLPMSFAEKHYHHGVVKVTLDEGWAVEIEKLEYTPLVRLLSIPCLLYTSRCV